MNASWRTTIAGIAAIVAAICGVVSALVDNNPATNPDWATTIAAITAGLGLISARDNGVTSEDAGAK